MIHYIVNYNKETKQYTVTCLDPDTVWIFEFSSYFMAKDFIDTIWKTTADHNQKQ